MKYVMFLGDVAPHGSILFDKLIELGFHCSKVKTADEVDQVGQQYEKAIMIFCDHKLAYRFLAENYWSGFPIFSILYLPKKPVMTPDAEKKLSSVHLNVFTPSDGKLLVSQIDGFIQTGKLATEKNFEIEFSVYEDLQEKK